MTPAQGTWLMAMFGAASKAGHKWPAAAACEAAAETGWGQHIPPNSNNVLGIKAYRGWRGKTVTADGTEQNGDGTWTGKQSDLWCVFDSPTDCFKEQMLILQEPRYAAAMEALTIEAYIVLECAVWSTAQAKGKLVLEIYEAHKNDLR